jgi:arylsulfatase A-like enzyme
MKSKLFCLLLAALLPAALAVRAQNESLASIFTNAPQAAKGRPAIFRRSSIIFIACHGLAMGDLSCYGQTNFQTPNLDRLAAEGTRFTDFRAASDQLPRAQAALALGDPAALPASAPTLASRLQQEGYHTGLIGEWTLGAQPWTQGFNEFAGFINEQEADNYYSDFVWRYAPKSVYDETNRTLKAWVGREEIYDNTGGRKGKYLPDVFLSAMDNFVRVNVPDFANLYRPFFLLVNLPAPHSVTPGQDDYPVPTDAPFSGEAWPQAAKNRAALVTRLDNGVGRLLEQLEKLHLTNNVAIFLTGAVAPEKFAGTGMNFLKLKDEVRGGDSDARLRVPMIVRWPGHVPAKRVSQAAWTTSDLAPTALAIAYAKPAAAFHGISMLPILLGEHGTNAPEMPSRSGHTF